MRRLKNFLYPSYSGPFLLLFALLAWHSSGVQSNKSHWEPTVDVSTGPVWVAASQNVGRYTSCSDTQIMKLKKSCTITIHFR